MSDILIITEGAERLNGLQSGIVQKGFACSITTASRETIKRMAKQPPDLVLVEINSHATNPEIRELLRTIKQEKHLPIIPIIALASVKKPFYPQY